MKKERFIALMSLLLLVAGTLVSCSSDNDDDSSPTVNTLEQNYITIENATYNTGNIPTATTSESLDDIDMSTQVMNGAMNYITVTSQKNISKFFIGVKNVNGYLTYVPQPTSTSGEYNMYVIPVMISQAYTGEATIMLSGQLDNGDITSPAQKNISYIETMPGAIEVKLAFSNSKDVDLHLYTPNGTHIYFGNRGGTYTLSDGSTVTYGLDVDSNAGCNIDDINKENIYIPQELVESGTYTVVVDMYDNCQSSIATDWSIIARYQGQLIHPTSGTNPASGVYPIGAGNGDHTQVMTFTVGNAAAHSKAATILNNAKFTPKVAGPYDQFKLMNNDVKTF